MAQPPNSITVSRVNPVTGQLLKPLVMLQPLPLGPYGFIEKLWPEGVPFQIDDSTPDIVQRCNTMLGMYPVIYNNHTRGDYEQYVINPTAFKTKHINVPNKLITIPTEALQTRRMICLMYEGGLYHKATTGSFDIIKWFMLLPSSQSPHLYPVEIKLQPNSVEATLHTHEVHASGVWNIEFEQPEILAKYIETYTDHVVEALDQIRMYQYVNANANNTTLYTATPRITPEQYNPVWPVWDGDYISEIRKRLGI